MPTVQCPTCGNLVASEGSSGLCLVDGTTVPMPMAPAPERVPPKPKAKDPDGWVSIADELEAEEQPRMAPAPQETRRTKKGR